MTAALPKLLRKQAVKKIETSAGKIFRIKVKKRDGSTRWMKCRMGVSKYVKGVGLNYDPKEKDLITVFDMEAENPERGYRSIAIEGIRFLRIGGIKYRIVDKK